MSGQFGVLLDVSGSMKNTYSLDTSHDTSVERTHAILTTLINIVKRELVHHQRKDSIFVGVFGLNDKHTPVVTCDLVALLKVIAAVEDGHEALFKLAKEHDMEHVKRWINEFSHFEAKILYKCLQSNEHLMKKMIEAMPSTTATRVSEAGKMIGESQVGKAIGLGSVLETVEQTVVTNSEGHILAQKIINDQWKQFEIPEAKPVCEVSEILDKLFHKDTPTSATCSSLQSKIHDLIEPIKPYIYGQTPLCKALNHALDAFEKKRIDSKVLFLLSDGQSTDGDPLPIAEKLHDSGVTIVTCFLTSDEIAQPRCLLYEEDPSWDSRDGRSVLFKMSSKMQNTDAPITHLIDVNWQLPSSGESRLFVQANSLDVVNEFCKIVVSQLTNKTFDAIVNVLQKIPLATYINQKNADFKPKKQEGGTCYANAIAAVFHLAMHRIVGREGGTPNFYTIRKSLIEAYGEEGANTQQVLQKVCPEYRLHYKQVDETKARQAINKRRPVVARFWLYDEQWDQFSAFYRKTPKGILEKTDIGDGQTNPAGHAVVLIRCNPNCLTFMNSWGKEFADGGFFRVKDQNVLTDTTFYDVYWTENDLTPSEKKALEMEGTKQAKTLMELFPSIKDVKCNCPKCNQISNINEFNGNVLEATCPKCHQKFEPKTDLKNILYVRNAD